MAARADTQIRFGRVGEPDGPAARYPTANVEALRNLPWTVAEFEKLVEQWGLCRPRGTRWLGMIGRQSR